MGHHADPVIAPPANLSRASGTPEADHFPDAGKMVFTPTLDQAPA